MLPREMLERCAGGETFLKQEKLTDFEMVVELAKNDKLLLPADIDSLYALSLRFGINPQRR